MLYKPKSIFFKRVSKIVLLLGIALGIVGGFVIPRSVIEYTYPSIQKDPHLVEQYNDTLMVSVCLGSLILFFLFYAIYCVLSYQEEMIDQLRFLTRSVRERNNEDNNR